MKYFNVYKHLTLASIATATFATLSLGMIFPAAAARFKFSFCGFFDGNVGRVEPDSFVEIDTDETNNFGLVDANIQTTSPVGQNRSTYTFSDFTGNSGRGSGIPKIQTFQKQSVYWRFGDSGNNFNAVIPATVYDNPERGTTFNISDNSEIRAGGSLRKEKDPGATVPEPLTLLGSVTALGVGIALKREYSKRRQKAAHEGHR